MSRTNSQIAYYEPQLQEKPLPALADSMGKDSPILATLGNWDGLIRSAYFTPGNLDSLLQNVIHYKSSSDHELDPIFIVISCIPQTSDTILTSNLGMPIVCFTSKFKSTTKSCWVR